MPFPATHPALERALADQGYAEPTPVQAAVLADAAPGRDLLVSAQTGSGKTVAYGLAMAATVLGDAPAFGPAGAPLALIVAPTRELAVQVHRELGWLYGAANARLTACIGGMDARREQRALAAGAHIVVGTPGRLRDHLERGHLDISQLSVVVLDEADEMLDLGFREDLEFILDATPPERQTLLFSATIARDIAALAKRFQRDAVRIDTTASNEPHGDIEYLAMRCAPSDVEHAVVNVLRFYEARGALVFCSTRDAVRHLNAALLERGFAAVALSGELSQNERSTALQSLRDGRARVCVATDVAARGLDLPDLGLVIHADIPVNRAGLLHRSGRTGRAGRKGVSVLIVPHPKRRRAEQLIANAGVDATWQGPPTGDAIRQRDQERMLTDPILTEVATPEDLVLADALLEGRTAQEIAAALIRLHRSRLPAPEDLIEEGPALAGRYDPQARAQGGLGRVRGKIDEDGQESAPTPWEKQADAVWFRLNVGRRKNADPKWLIPLICRLGHVTKREIGSIRVFDSETKFEIAKDVAERFAQTVKGQAEGDNRIEPAADPGARSPRPERKAYPPKGEGFKPKPDFKPREDRPAPPRADFKPREDRPAPPRAEFAPRPPREDRPAEPRPQPYDPARGATVEPPAARPFDRERPKKEGAFKKEGTFKKEGFKKEGFKKEGFKKDFAKDKPFKKEGAFKKGGAFAGAPGAAKAPFKKSTKGKSNG